MTADREEQEKPAKEAPEAPDAGRPAPRGRTPHSTTVERAVRPAPERRG